MSASSHILQDLAVALSVAAVTTVVFQKLRQPVVLGYLLAGLIVGPYTFPDLFVSGSESVRNLSELGVLLIMFSLGLELSLRRLLRVGAPATLVALIEMGLMLWLGFSAGLAFGWSHTESLFLGAAVCISSTTIITRAFKEEKATGRAPHLVFGILVVEDVIAVLLLTVLTAIARGTGTPGSSVLDASLGLGIFLVVVFVVGILVIPRLFRMLVRMGRDETLLIASVGLCFGLALLADSRGYSPALGAFLAGILVAESGHAKRIEHLVQPVRDVFAAVFFVGIGMLLDPSAIVEHWPLVLVIALLTTVGKMVGASVGTFLAGESTHTSVKVGMSLAQNGEFSFLIAELGISLGVVRESFYPMTIGVCALTSFTTPYWIRSSDAASEILDRKLPKPLQTFVTLYGSWVDSLGRRRRQPREHSRARQKAAFLALDAAGIVAIVILASLNHREVADFLAGALPVPEWLVRFAVVAGVLLVLTPFLLGIFRMARAVAIELATQALPASNAGVDLGRAPRGALVATLQFVVLTIVGIPMLMITQPFLPPFRGGLVFIALAALVAVAFWRSVRDVHGHVRAGTQIIVSSLIAQTAPEQTQSAIHEIETTLPGVGSLDRFEVKPGFGCIGQSLSDLNLRGDSGANVLAILRPGGEVVTPEAEEVLRADDVLILNGTRDAIREAAQLLRNAEPAEEA